MQSLNRTVPVAWRLHCCRYVNHVSAIKAFFANYDTNFGDKLSKQLNKNCTNYKKIDATAVACAEKPSFKDDGMSEKAFQYLLSHLIAFKPDGQRNYDNYVISWPFLVICYERASRSANTALLKTSDLHYTPGKDHYMCALARSRAVHSVAGMRPFTICPLPAIAHSCPFLTFLPLMPPALRPEPFALRPAVPAHDSLTTLCPNPRTLALTTPLAFRMQIDKCKQNQTGEQNAAIKFRHGPMYAHPTKHELNSLIALGVLFSLHPPKRSDGKGLPTFIFPEKISSMELKSTSSRTKAITKVRSHATWPPCR